jgi:hypothetical protein
MASKKTTKPASSKTKPAPQPSRLQNLAANPVSFDDTIDDEQLADHSGLFRVTNALQQAQIGHDEEPTRRFPGPRERTGHTHQPKPVAGQPVADDSFDEAVTDHVISDEAARAEKAARLATLAERARQPKKPR